ncbi:MAG: M20/M25/M40 family metallo-hydrolase [Sandaracinus sp.]
MAPDTATLLDAAVDAAFEREQLPLLAALVEQSSCSREPEDVEACFAILDRRAKELGLTIETVPDARGEVAAHRVYATAACTPTTRALALVGHLDTVFPRAMGLARFRREGDVARGAGVLDMKSGLSALFAGPAALRAAVPELASRLALRIVVVSDEEIGSPSSAALYARLAPLTTGALVFEAGREADRIVTRRRGGGLYTIEARGHAAHAGNAYLEGTNAIVALALALPRVEALGDPARGTTLSIGLVEGGTAKNTVPERAVAHLDARYETTDEVRRVEEGMRSIVADPFAGLGEAIAPARLRRAQLVLSGGMTRPPMQPLAGTASLFERYASCATAVGLGAEEAPLQGGGSDANLLVHHGVPCLDGLGPYGRFFHETREWCSLESLVRRTRALARFLALATP